MRAKLFCGVVAVLLIGADSGPTVNTAARPDFPPGSRWEQVRGRKGDTEVVGAYLLFRENNQYELQWSVLGPTPGNGGFTLQRLMDYNLHPQTALPVASWTQPGWRYEATFRLVGDCLEIWETEKGGNRNPEEPQGELYLLLKRVK